MGLPESGSSPKMNSPIFIFILSGICFSTVDAIAKILIQDTNLIIVVWYRFFGQLLLAIPIAWYFLGKRFWRTSNLKLQLFRSCLLVATATLFFAGLNWLPLAEASSITFSPPIWVALLSKPILGERVGPREWLVAGVGFLGILLIARPGSAIFHLAALLLVAMAFFNAIFQLYTRKLVGDSAYTTFFYSGIIGLATSTALLPYAEPLPPLPIFKYVLFGVLGLLGGLAHLLVVLAFYKMKPYKLTPLVFLQLIWAVAYGYLIFGQLPDGLSVVGMALIATSGIWLIWNHRSNGLENIQDV
jgi:drug/metabolite transporter (DMT)-like permease